MFRLQFNLQIISFLLVTLFISGCFFQPSMNLPPNLPQSRVSQAGHVKVTITPIDQLTVESSAALPEIYTVGSGDVITFTILGHPEISNNIVASRDNISSAWQYNLGGNNVLAPSMYLVDNFGNVDLPYIGEVNIGGKNNSEIVKVIAKAYLDAKIIKKPKVSFRILTYRSKRVFVFGEVLQPSSVPLNDVPTSLATALQSGGSFNMLNADVRGVYVLRKNSKDSIDAFMIDASNASNLVYASKFYLRNDDIVYVSTANIAQYNRVMNSILPTTEALWYGKTAFTNADLLLVR